MGMMVLKGSNSARQIYLRSAFAMNKSSEVLCLLEIIYAKHVVREIQNMRCEFSCGCKIRDQDCLMMDEHETSQIIRGHS